MLTYNYGETVLKVHDINLNYGSNVVLKGVSVEIKKIFTQGNQTPGQVVGFIGPSGIGKTSLFRIIAGLNKPTSGEVYIRQCSCGRPDCKREQCEVQAGDVGVVTQTYTLFNHRTVMSNLMLAATQKCKDPKEAREKVQALLADYELADKANLYPAQLSGGQRQRVAILQQVLCSEHMMLMDEPFSGLDMMMIEKTQALIQRVAAMEGNTIIIVTHDITAAAAVSDHLWMMGRDRDAQGNIIPGAYIVETYDLLARGLAWQPEIQTQARFNDFVREVKTRFRTL